MGGNKGCFYCHLIATYYHFWHKISKISGFLRDFWAKTKKILSKKLFFRFNTRLFLSFLGILLAKKGGKLRSDAVKDTS